MTAEQRMNRNRAIFDARARGFGWDEIARQHDVSVRQAQRIHSEYRDASPGALAADPIATVEELLAGHDAALEDLARLANDAKHDGARLGAIRARLDVMREKYELLAAVGVLPRDLGQVAVQIDSQRIADATVAVLERHAVPEHVFDEILEALGGPPSRFAAELAGATALTS